MGRTKNVPKKKEILSLGNCSLSTIGEFIPLYRKKRNNKKQETQSVPSYSLAFAKTEQEQYFLGELRIGRTSNVLPTNLDPCKISFKYSDDSTIVILTFSETCVVINAIDDISFVKDVVQTKIFAFNIIMVDDHIFFKIYLISVPLPKFYPKVSKCIKAAFSLFYNLEHSTESTNVKSASLSNSELNDLYNVLAQRRVNFENHRPVKEDLQLSQLKPQLRPYQKQAVRWMIYRESTPEDLSGNIHPLYQKITLKSSTEIYFDKYSGWIEKTPPLVQSKWTGGILADEMGLGKTVEILALILSNPKTPNALSVNKGKIVDSDSDSDTELVIKTQPKKRKLIDEDNYYYKMSPKIYKVDEKFLKPRPNRKSATFRALQSLYNQTLIVYCTTESKEEPEECKIQCICGTSIEDGSVECVECGKWQHSACLGWRRNLGEYKCPQCWETASPLVSKATLIVAPIALRKQWCREMKTHLKSGLKVLHYEGYTATPVYPTEFQQYDIVITTYTVLQAEMRLTETGQSLNLRKQRKYWPGGSPLIRVKWWRLCLDEAQTVETPGRVVSLMARKIPACHRWAVTGTPMAKGVTDIYGLIDYLQMEPYSDFDTWKNILYDPYINGNKEPIYDFLSKVLWRTTKNAVLDQINIPKQSHKLHLLEFSAVEKFFYSCEHDICARDFLMISQKFNTDSVLEKLDKKDLKNLMAPLLSLRQACSDPSVVRGKGRYLSLKKKASSMKDLLEALILKNRTDCEESLRLMISSINGLAGVYLLMENQSQAIEEYRKVLQLAARFSIEEKEGKLTIDKLPLIHAMHNLAEVLEIYPSTEHTLRDSSLKSDCDELEKQYIEKFMKEATKVKESYESFTSIVEKYENEFALAHGKWYSDGFDWVAVNDAENDFIARLEVAAVNSEMTTYLRSETTRTLLRKAYNWHIDLDELRIALINAITNIYDENNETKLINLKTGLVEKAMNCHLRPQQQPKTKKKIQKCPVCVANSKLKDYETTLFNMQKRKEIFQEMSLVGNWKSRLEEILLKVLLAQLKIRNVDPTLIKDGETHIALIEALKKEFKEIRKFWMLLDQLICATDEVSICKVRLQLKTGDESKETANKALKSLSLEGDKTLENINLIKPAELPHQELLLRSEEIRHNARLESLLGTRNYLGTLRQQQFEGQNPDPCPICRGPLTNTWAILSCAHTFCLECFQKLIDKALLFIQCCVCRCKQNLQDVAYIRSGTRPQETSEDETPVIGNYSRKVEDVVRLLFSLRRQNPHVKVLLFSAWHVVLKLLKKALDQNSIKAELADSNSLFEKRIENFKDPFKQITVLLLPLRLGAKGLNLIEATHVILLEPVLNPADELQAIGRVHRIGQTRPTVVHKFLVRNTVEESLHEATSSNAAGWEKGKLTIGQLKGLFKNTVEDAEQDEIPSTNTEDNNTPNIEDFTLPVASAPSNSNNGVD